MPDRSSAGFLSLRRCHQPHVARRNLCLSPGLIQYRRIRLLPGAAGEKGAATMATDKECVDNARECVRLAQLTTDQEVRDRLLNIARRWMDAAMRARLARAVAPAPASPSRAA